MATMRDTTTDPATAAEPLPPLDDLLPLGQVPQHLPGRAGKRCHRSVPYRWATRGLRGHRLRTVYVPPAGLCTTLPWLRQFLAGVAAMSSAAAASPPPRRPRRRRRSGARTQDRAARTASTLRRHRLPGGRS